MDRMALDGVSNGWRPPINGWCVSSVCGRGGSVDRRFALAVAVVVEGWVWVEWRNLDWRERWERREEGLWEDEERRDREEEERREEGLWEDEEWREREEEWREREEERREREEDLREREEELRERVVGVAD